jgi:GWxTD domain-containing protein
MRPVVPVCFCLCALALVAGGCAPSGLDASDAGKSASYQPGTASFDIEVAPLHGDEETGIDLYVGVPPPSLVYSRTPQGFRALYDLTLRLSDRATAAFAGEFMWKETTDVAAYDATQRFDPLVVFHRIELPPGSYVAEVTLEDLADRQKATRRQGFVVVDPTLGQPAVGRLILQSRTPEGRFLPRVSFHVPALAESLRCAVEVYNAERDVPVSVAIQILRFPADTTFALPPFTYSVMARPMGYGLMHLDRADTVLRIQRETRITRRKQTLAFYLPLLPEGLYRFDFQVTLPQNAEMPAETTMSASRFSSLKGTGFPRPSTLGEMIAATGYIATSKEYAELTSAPQAIQRAKFEAFWLNLGGTKAAAASLIKRYYTRVEEANRLFTTVREGWKTDRGMLYIVLGPPVEIASRLDKQDWGYSFPGGGTSSNLYSFKRIIYQGEGLSVEEFVLQRRSDYEGFWDRMVDKWRGPGGP